MAQQILLRRGTALQWTTANPILAQGEQGLETDTNLIKIGNGSTTWTLLNYTSAIGLLKANNLSDLTNVVTARTNLGLGTLATQNGTFSGTSSGTNTGDNAVNSSSQPVNTNLTSLSGLTYSSLSFIKMTAAGTFVLDTNTYLTTISGITAGGELSGTYPNPTLVNNSVTAKILTGLNITGGSISATDSIITAFGKIQNQINGVLGGVSLTTSHITEGSNLYFTNARVNTQVATYTGDVTLSGTVFSIGSAKVTNAMLVNGAVANLSGTNTGDQTITLTGAVTGSGTGSFVTTLASAIVGISNLSATGTPSSTTFLRGDNTWATPAGGGGGLSDGDKGDITVSSSGSVWTLDTVTANKGGTGQTSYAVGDLLFATGTTNLGKLAAVATGNVLISGGFITAPSWGKVGLTTHVSGTLPVANGGTGITSAGGIGSLLVGSGTTSFNTVAGNTTTTKKYLTQTGDGVDSDDPVWESLETVGISWITYSDTITWNSTAPSGATTHEYRYYQIGKMVFGFIRLEYANAGVTNTTLTLATNSFPVISKPSNAANGENMIACTGYIDSSNTGSPPATRCWMEASANTSGFVVKFVAASQSAKFAMCSFTYLTA